LAADHSDRLFDLDILSLIEMSGDERYRQHPLLADFAQEQLALSELAEERLAAYYLDLIAQNRTGYAALGPEWDNIMASMHSAYRHKTWPTVIDFARALTAAWFARGRYTQARQGAAWACEAANMLGDRGELARHTLTWGEAALEQTDYPEAKRLIQESLALAQETGQDTLIAKAELELVRMAFRQTDYVAAKGYLVHAKQSAMRLGDDRAIAVTLHWQAQLAYRHGDYDSAARLSEEALELQESISDLMGALRTLRLLADIDLVREAYDSALDRNRLALQYAETEQDRGETAAAYYGLAVVQRRLGDLRQASDFGEKSLQLAQFTGDRRFQATVLHELAIIRADMGSASEALIISCQSLALWRDLEDKFGLTYCLLHLGDIYATLDRLADARDAWQQALMIAGDQGHPALATLQARLGHGE
jgi:tetratricopeptide (TPR) repeat protein